MLHNISGMILLLSNLMIYGSIVLGLLCWSSTALFGWPPISTEFNHILSWMVGIGALTLIPSSIVWRITGSDV